MKQALAPLVVGATTLGVTAEHAELVAFRVGERDSTRPVGPASVRDRGRTESDETISTMPTWIGRQ